MSDKDALLAKDQANMTETDRMLKKIDEIIVAIKGKEGGK